MVTSSLFTVKVSDTRHAVEIGTFNGFRALTIAAAEADDKPAGHL